MKLSFSSPKTDNHMIFSDFVVKDIAAEDGDVSRTDSFYVMLSYSLGALKLFVICYL